MIDKLLIGSLISINLFSANSQLTQNAVNTSDSDSPLKTHFKAYQEALPADEESKNQKESLKNELEKHAQNLAQQNAEEETKEKRQEKIDEWNKDFPVLEGNSNPENFVNEISKEAVKIAHEEGIYPSVMIAQAGLESSWGSSGLAQEYNNLMGTKGSWNGQSVVLSTNENYNGGNVTINAGFSVYDSWGDSLARYGSLLRNGPEDSNSDLYSGAWKENADSYKDATAWLEGRYATDPNYSSKLNQTIEKLNLTKFDEIDVLTEDKLNEIKVEPEQITLDLSVPEGMTEVENGESLRSIAEEYDVPVDDLIEWNNLEDGDFVEGKFLIVSETEELFSLENFAQADIEEKVELFL